MTTYSGGSNMRVAMWDGTQVWSGDDALKLQHARLSEQEVRSIALDALGQSSSTKKYDFALDYRA